MLPWTCRPVLLPDAKIARAYMLLLLLQRRDLQSDNSTETPTQAPSSTDAPTQAPTPQPTREHHRQVNQRCIPSQCKDKKA